MRAVIVGALLFLGVASFAACSGDDSSATGGNTGGAGGSSGGSGGTGGAGGGGDEDASTACADRTDVDLYTANMTKKGKNGSYSFLLVQSDPGPPAKGMNVWKVKVTGPDGMPFAMLKDLKVDISMPEHRHNSPISPVLSYDAASGTFGVNPVYLSMGGKWRILFEVKGADALTIDSAEFFFCVD